MKRFTDKWIASIKSTDKKQEFNAGDGFLLRVAMSGSKTFYFRYKIDGKKKFIKLGTYPACTLEIAKKKHLEAWTAFKNGIDPQESSSDVVTLGELANYWYDKYIVKNRKVPLQIKQQIDADIIPLLGAITLKDVTTRKLTLALDKIVDRGSPVHANKILSSLKQMFNYAISKGIYIGSNPLIGTKANDIGGEEKPRERNLSMQEIAQVWLYLDSDKHRIPKYSVNAIKLLILTGCRLSEIQKATWPEFSIPEQLWTIPKDRYKTGIEHKVHLTPLIIKLLNELKTISGSSKFILPSTTNNNAPLSDKALSRAIARSQDRIGIDKFTIHDVRRSFASRMADHLDVDVIIVERLLGHKLAKIFETYQKSEMLEKRKNALERWSDTIARLTAGDNVIPFKRVV